MFDPLSSIIVVTVIGGGSIATVLAVLLLRFLWTKVLAQ